MVEQEETVVESTEETTEVNETENETETATEGESETEQAKTERKPETPEARRARIKRQYEREFGKEASKESKEGPKEEVTGDERYTRLELKTEGITSKKEQDIVMDYANWKKIDVSEALKSPTVKAELAEYRAKASVPAPSNRTGTGSNNSLEYWIGQARKGNFPRSDKAMMKQLEKARIFTK